MAKGKKLSPEEQSAVEEVRRIEAGGTPPQDPEPPKSLWSRRDFLGPVSPGPRSSRPASHPSGSLSGREARPRAA